MRGSINRVIELTGTPAPNGLEDLWAQIYLLDGGDRLGRYISQYRDRYFKPGRGNGTVVYEWLPCDGAKEEIAEKIADISLSMKSEDYLEMPKVSYIYQQCPLEPKEMEAYRQFESDFVMSSDTETITAQTAAALANKLIQFTGGALKTVILYGGGVLMMGGILSLTCDVFKAVCMAVWLHGYLAEEGCKKYSIQNFPIEEYPAIMDEVFRRHGF